MESGELWLYNCSNAHYLCILHRRWVTELAKAWSLVKCYEGGREGLLNWGNLSEVHLDLRVNEKANPNNSRGQQQKILRRINLEWAGQMGDLSGRLGSSEPFLLMPRFLVGTIKWKNGHWTKRTEEWTFTWMMAGVGARRKLESESSNNKIQEDNTVSCRPSSNRVKFTWKAPTSVIVIKTQIHLTSTTWYPGCKKKRRGRERSNSTVSIS